MMAGEIQRLAIAGWKYVDRFSWIFFMESEFKGINISKNR
jgi:hypothetical protein